MKKGFTLIELLAVIVILAIIALITIPIIADSISESRDKSAIRAAELYVQAIDQELTKKNMDGTFTLEDGWYAINDEGNIMLPRSILEIKAKNKPQGGSIYIKNMSAAKVSQLNINGKYVSTVNGEYILLSSDEIFLVGDIVYFDIESGEPCTKSEYESSKGEYETIDYNMDWVTVQDYGNSKSGYNGIKYKDVEDDILDRDSNQNSCLMFYVLSSYDDRVNLILDHNTSMHASWALDDATNGPTNALEVLKEDTKNWQGTLTPTSYSYIREKDSCYARGATHDVNCDSISYTIDYTGYNARLITIEEVASIANLKSVDRYMKTSLYAQYSSTNDIMKNIGWLYDRLNPMLLRTSYDRTGMAHPSINHHSDWYVELGYWTASASWYRDYSDRDENCSAMVINYRGYMDSQHIESFEKSAIRPVIEVSIDKLK